HAVDRGYYALQVERSLVVDFLVQESSCFLALCLDFARLVDFLENDPIASVTAAGLLVLSRSLLHYEILGFLEPDNHDLLDSDLYHAGLLRNLGARHRRLSVLTEPNVAHVAKPVYRRRPALLAKHQERGLLLYPGEDERPERLAVAVEPCAVEKHLDVRRGSPLALLGVLDDSRLLDRGGGYWLGLVLRLL